MANIAGMLRTSVDLETRHKQAQLFENLSDESLQKILHHSILQEYEGDKLLVQQGDVPDYVYFVIEGALKTFRIDEEGKEATFRMIQSGDTCMEAVMFMGGPSPIYVQTMTVAKVLLIPERIIKSHALEDSKFAVNLLRIVTRHYKNSMHQIDAMTIKSPLQRIGYYFLLKYLDSGRDQVEFTLPFQKQAVANYLGMTPETFSRTLKRLKEFGVSIDDGKVKLKNAFALCHFCDSDTEALCSNYKGRGCRSCLST